MDKRTELAITLGQTIYNNTITSLTQQRDELLAALEGVLPFLTGNYWPGVEADAAVDRAIAAARKVGAGGTAPEGPNEK